MSPGYNQPLYILPFDHRHSYGSEVFGYHEPMTPAQIADVAASKQVIYDGFRQALANGVAAEQAGILVDEEFGAAILQDARERGYAVAMPLEKSGQNEFDFEFADFAAHLQAFRPTFAKVLVRYNPDGDAALNAIQAERVKRLFDYCHSHSFRCMFELLVPAESQQLAAVGGDRHVYDTQVRPGLMVRAIEGLDERADCERIVAAARRAGRDQVSCIILGRGENEQKVLEWLRVAAGVPGFTGFAVGRSSFLASIIALRAGQIDRARAVAEIAAKFQEWVTTFEAARGS
jgi:myo-inositol catabolism protein IolC